ncbi:MAG: oligosaccharide flippase family protein [bacterium]
MKSSPQKILNNNEANVTKTAAIKAFFYQKFIRDVSFNLVSSFIVALSGILLNIIVANNYNVAGFGLFNQVMAIYIILSIITAFGFHISIIRHTAECRNNIDTINELITSALIFISLFSTILTIVLLASLTLADSFIKSHLLIIGLKNIIISLPFFSLNKILMGFLNGLRKMRTYAFSQIARCCFLIFFILYSIFYHKPVTFSLYAFPFAEILLFSVLSLYVKRFFNFSLNNLQYWIKKHILFSITSLMADSMSDLNSKMDILVIGWLMSDYHVGIYSFASTIAKGFIMISGVLQLNFNPIISRLWAEKHIDKLNECIEKLKKTSFIIMLSILSIAALLYPVFLRIFIKNNLFLNNSLVFYILLIGIFIYSTNYWAGGILEMVGHPKEKIKLASIALVFNFICHIVLIKLLGINGAAIATTLTYTLIIILLKVFTKNKLDIKL